MYLTMSVLSIINPGQGTAPPGVSGPVTTIISWTAWIVFALCVAGILTVGGKLAIAHQQGRGGEHGQGLAFVLGGAVLAASASGLIGALV
jgi:hypothetical protein